MSGGQALLSRLRARPRVRAVVLMIRAAPGLSLLAAGFVIAEGVLPVLVLVAMGRVVGAIPAAVTHGLGSPDGHALIAALAVAGGIYALSLMRGPLEDAVTAAVTARVEAHLEAALIDGVCRPVGVTPLEDPAVLERLASARGDLLNAQPASASMMVVSLAGDRLTGVLACGVLAVYQWWLGLGLLVMWLLVRPPLARQVRARTMRARGAGPVLRRSWYMLGLAYRPPAAKEMRVFGLADWAAERHREQWLEAMEPSWRLWRRLDRQVWAAGLVVALVYAAIAIRLGFAAEQGEIGLRGLATLLPMLPASLSAGSISYADVQAELALTSLPDVDALLAELSDADAEDANGDAAADDEIGGEGTAVRHPEGPRHPEGLPRIAIRLEDVRYAYPGGEPVLDGVTLELAAGGSLGLVGVNGAGKSTLVTLLARMREPTAGRILVDGIALAELDARAWQSHVAVVYQDATRLPLSAAENIGMFGAGRPDLDRVRRAAERAAAAELLAGLPDGLDTVLAPGYTGGVDLSGGQWQRIALARALYAVDAGARLLVLDEPTAQLDVRAEAAFYDSFLALTRGVTTIVISHRFASVRRADRIAVLDGGRITELGAHAELVTAGGVYAEMFALQAVHFTDAGARG